MVFFDVYLQNVRLVHEDTATVCKHPHLGEYIWGEIRRPSDQECKQVNTLTLMVGEEEVGRVDVESKVLRNLTGIKIFVVGSKDGAYPDIKGLVVLDKP